MIAYTIDYQVIISNACCVNAAGIRRKRLMVSVMRVRAF